MLTAYFGQYTQDVILVLTFLAGLLIGLAIKKGVVAIVLGVVGYIVASYIQLPFIPTFSTSGITSSITNTATSYTQVLSLTHITVTFSLILFAIGLAAGLLKG